MSASLSCPLRAGASASGAVSHGKIVQDWLSSFGQAERRKGTIASGFSSRSRSRRPRSARAPPGVARAPQRPRSEERHDRRARRRGLIANDPAADLHPGGLERPSGSTTWEYPSGG